MKNKALWIALLGCLPAGARRVNKAIELLAQDQPIHYFTEGPATPGAGSRKNSGSRKPGPTSVTPETPRPRASSFAWPASPITAAALTTAA
jgi:hypothetical protein